MSTTEQYKDLSVPQYDNAETHFRKISEGDQEALKWYSDLMQRVNLGVNAGNIFISREMVWNGADNNIYVFVSFFTKKETPSSAPNHSKL